MDDQGTTGVRAFFLKEKRPEEVGVDDFGLIRHAPPFGAWHQPVGRSAPLRSRFKSFDKVERPDLRVSGEIPLWDLTKSSTESSGRKPA
jgi:hypothetical protein